jgi:hypothetical protein
LVGDRGGGDGLDEPADATDDMGFEEHLIAGTDDPEEFGIADGGEFETGQRWVVGIGLGDRAGELGGGFDEEDPGHERIAGEMAAEKGFIAAEPVAAVTAEPRFELGEFVEKAELGSMGQGIERGIGMKGHGMAGRLEA